MIQLKSGESTGRNRLTELTTECRPISTLLDIELSQLGLNVLPGRRIPGIN